MNVQVKIPMLGKEYEFELDEDADLKTLIREMTALVCQREHCQIRGNMDKLLLFHANSKKLLSVNQTLIQAGIKIGDTLILS